MSGGKHTITSTRNYRLFTFSDDNRKRDAKKHKKLFESMQQYGYLASFPIVCTRKTTGELVVKDGQHRLMFAEELALPVSYVVEAIDFDVAVVNSTPKVWALVDYAEKHAAHGIKAYIDGLEFADRHKLPIGTAFSLLAGTVSFSNILPQFMDGTFVITDLAWAERVAFVYRQLTRMSDNVVNKRCVEACMAVCRVDEFDPKRLIHGAERNRESLVAYSTRDGYLEMLETLYNFGRRQLFPLKITAIQAMRERNCAKPKAATQPRKSHEAKAASAL